MSRVVQFKDLVGKNLTKEGWKIAIRNFIRVDKEGEMIDLGFFPEGTMPWDVAKFYALPFRECVIESHFVLVKGDVGFDLSTSEPQPFQMQTLLVEIPAPPVKPSGTKTVFPREDDFVPRHPYHPSRESEGPDPTTHPSWKN